MPLKKLKIAIFADNFLPQVNGVVTSIYNLVKGLSEKGHKVLVIVPKYRKYSYPDFGPNVEILSVRSAPALFYADLKMTTPFNRRIYKAVRDGDYDVLHFHAPMMLGFQALLISRALKKPLIGTFHTFFGEKEYLKHAKLDYGFVQDLAWNYSRLYYNRCDLVTTPTEAARKILVQNGINKLSVAISNGIDPTLFENGNTEAMRKKYAKNGGPLAIYVGRIAHEKNLNLLVDAFKKVVQKVPNARLILVGDGPQSKALQKHILKNDLADSVKMLGVIPHDELVKSGLYKACDLFMTASKTETQQLTILEAMVNGLACIGVNAKGVPDMIKNDQNGFCVEPDNVEQIADATIKIFSDKKMMEKLKKGSLELAKEHFIENVISKWEKTYFEVKESFKPDYGLIGNGIGKLTRHKKTASTKR